MTPHDAAMPFDRYALAVLVSLLWLVAYFTLVACAVGFHRRGVARLRAHRRQEGGVR